MMLPIRAAVIGNYDLTEKSFEQKVSESDEYGNPYKSLILRVNLVGYKAHVKWMLMVYNLCILMTIDGEKAIVRYNTVTPSEAKSINSQSTKTEEA